MSWYRDKYLRSEDWKNLRAAILATRGKKGICRLCGEKKSLDIHHLKYRKIYDVVPADLVPICRTCHERVHKLIALHPEIKKQSSEGQWRAIRAKIQTAPLEADPHLRHLMNKGTRGNGGLLPESLVKFKAKREKARAERLEFVRALDGQK